MRILYLCHRIPYPPDKGEKIRAFHQIKALRARHEIDLFTLADNPADLRQQAPLRDECASVTVASVHPRLSRLRCLPYLLTPVPLSIPYFRSTELRNAVRQALARRSYDRIFVYCSAMAQYVADTENIPIITDLVDIDSDKWTQYAAFTRFPFSAVYRREGKALRRYEQMVCARSSSVVVTTEREARLARQISPGEHVHVIPNGVDADYFRPSAVQPDEPVAGFTGDMSYFPNQKAVAYFAREVLPRIHRSLPAARFLIVGRNPSTTVRRLADLEGVEVTGFVPDVRTHLARMRVFVAPFSIAAGIQNKILEAMASGVPVVATTRAAQGLAPETAAAVEIADDPATMAVKVLQLLHNPELAGEKGREGRRRVAAEYDWQRSLDRLVRLVESSAPAAATRGREVKLLPLST
jgi:sugar transferase (PEP-CTERM/EpsH1 system associated)